MSQVAPRSAGSCVGSDLLVVPTSQWAEGVSVSGSADGPVPRSEAGPRGPAPIRSCISLWGTRFSEELGNS